MDLSHLIPQVKIYHENLQENQYLDDLKSQSEPLTEPSQEIKIKLETKVIQQKKQEPPENAQASLPDPSVSYQNSQLLQARKNKDIALKRRRRNLSQYERLEDVRAVASHFIEHGLNFRLFNQHYPDIDAKFYRNQVEAINNTAINEIEKYLRYECNIQIEKLNRDQKRSIRTQLTKVREWLGKKDMNQLQTLYKFIQRKYELVDVDISIEQGLKFYKTILQIVKSPFVDVMEDDIKPSILDPEIQKQAMLQEKQMQEKTLIFLYVQHRNLTKVSDLLCEKFGYYLQWSKHGVKRKIIALIRMSLKKLIGSVEAYDKTLKLFFSVSQECVKLIIKSQKSMNIKTFLLGFYLQKTITLIELRESIRNINKFFIQEFKDHGEVKCKKFEENVKIPKLEIKSQDLENIVTENQESQKENFKSQENESQLIKTQEIELRNSNVESKGMMKLIEKEKPKDSKQKNEYELIFEECLEEYELTKEEEGLDKIKQQA